MYPKISPYILSLSGNHDSKEKILQFNNAKPSKKQQHYPIWYAVHRSKPVEVTHVSPQKKLRPPTTIATWDTMNNEECPMPSKKHKQTSMLPRVIMLKIIPLHQGGKPLQLLWQSTLLPNNQEENNLT